MVIDNLYIKVLFHLLRIALGNENPSSSLSEERVRWDEVINLAMSQGLDAIAFDGIQALFDHSSREDISTLEGFLGAKKYEWFGCMLQAEQDYDAYCNVLRDLVSFYNSEDIPVLLLKGYGLSLNYPIPAHRPTGDIDIYLFGEWERSDQLFAAKRGIRIDNSHHHHSVFNFKGRSVENHYDFFNIYAHRSSRRIESILKERIAYDWTEYDLDGATLRLPGANFNALFLLRHNASHFASVNMNLRQVLDWLLFVRQHHNQVNWTWLYGILRQENMIRFANTLNTIGVMYLGFDRSLFPEIEEDNALVERVFNEILYPTYNEKEDGTIGKSLRVKPSRWWHNRWKHKLCYSDSLLSSFLNSLYAKILKPSHFVH